MTQSKIYICILFIYLILLESVTICSDNSAIFNLFNLVQNLDLFKLKAWPGG